MQLARLSLWLCTLAADKPLTFLDHHLRAGDSLVGASATDLARQPPGRGRGRVTALPLFESSELAGDLAATLNVRTSLAAIPDDTVEVVRAKERTIDDLTGPLRSACRLARDGGRVVRRVVLAVRNSRDRSACVAVPERRAKRDCLRNSQDIEATWRETAAAVSRGSGSFTGISSFPRSSSLPTASAARLDGFRRGDRKSAVGRCRRCGRLQPRVRLLPAAGTRPRQSLSALRGADAADLTRDGGRVGMLMPSGFLADHGCADLRRSCSSGATSTRCSVSTTARASSPFIAACGSRSITATRRGIDTGAAGTLRHACRRGTRRCSRHGRCARGSADSADTDPAIQLETAGRSRNSNAARSRDPGARSSRRPGAGQRRRVGRAFRPRAERDGRSAIILVSRGLPVLEGKDIDPFAARVEDARHFVEPTSRRAPARGRARIDSPRLGYREVASSTNRLTLIAAVIPAGVVTTHTIFCLRHRPTRCRRSWTGSYAASSTASSRTTSCGCAAARTCRPRRSTSCRSRWCRGGRHRSSAIASLARRPGGTRRRERTLQAIAASRLRT